MKKLLSLQRELLSITLALSLFSFAGALVGVFVPLIIIQSGFGLSAVAGFYVVYAFIKLALNYPVIRLIQRYGAHFGLGAGFLAGALQLAGILIFNRSHSLPALLLAAAALALTNAFLWSSQHIFISSIMDSSTKSSSMATMEIVRQILTAAAPLIGGFIGLAAGPGWLLAAALGVTLVAFIPLRHMGTHIAPPTLSEPPLRYDFSGAPWRDIVANFCCNINASTGNMIWPMYLAVAIHNYKNIGAISSLAAAAAVVMVWLAGHHGDRGHDRAILRQGSIGMSLVHFLRLAVHGVLSITLLSAAFQAVMAYFSNAWVGTYYHHAKARGTAYVMSMEIACDLAYIFLWSVTFILALSGHQQLLFAIAFIMAGIAAWGCLLITDQV